MRTGGGCAGAGTAGAGCRGIAAGFLVGVGQHAGGSDRGVRRAILVVLLDAVFGAFCGICWVLRCVERSGGRGFGGWGWGARRAGWAAGGVAWGAGGGQGCGGGSGGG